MVPPRLKCSTGPVQWTCTLKTQDGIPTLTVTMGKENEPPSLSVIDLFDLFGEEMDHHPTDDV